MLSTHASSYLCISQADSGHHVHPSRAISNFSHLNINHGVIAVSDPPDSYVWAAEGFVIYTFITFLGQINLSLRDRKHRISFRSVNCGNTSTVSCLFLHITFQMLWSVMACWNSSTPPPDRAIIYYHKVRKTVCSLWCFFPLKLYLQWWLKIYVDALYGQKYVDIPVVMVHTRPFSSKS